MGAILLRKIFVQLYISNCVIIRFIRELINKITHKLQTLSEDWDGNPPSLNSYFDFCQPFYILHLIFTEPALSTDGQLRGGEAELFNISKASSSLVRLTLVKDPMCYIFLES